jgi:DNA mismatch endonuclease (patch repair protein)
MHWMTDHLTKSKRSWNMSQIRSTNTRPELVVRSLLHSLGYRFRLHKKDLPGKPDIVLKRFKTVVFCHGCFWHQHVGCKRASSPKTNQDYWLPKLKRNRERFDLVKNMLIELGWKVIVVWECETKDIDSLKIKLNVIGKQ